MTLLSLLVLLQGSVLFSGQTGGTLQSQLKAVYSPVSLLSYERAQDSLYRSLHLKSDSVECFYSGFKVYLNPGADPSVSVYQNGDGLSLEHAFPQSKGASGTGKSDLHHLFPVKQTVNAARGNDHFAEIPDVNTDTWYHNGTSQSTKPLILEDEWSERDTETACFEVREEAKGNIARALFYFWLIYRVDADAADPDFFPSQMEDMLQWHRMDPPDPDEISRNTKIAAIQGNLNPFILDTSLVYRAYFEGVEEPESAPFHLFFSEYVEGSSNNKYLEIFNAGSLEVALSDLKVLLFSNGSTTPTNTTIPDGTLQPSGVLVLKNSAAAAYSGDAVPATVCNFNGDDALALVRISTGDTLDIFGRIGEDPGTTWISGDFTTLNSTLVRKSSVTAGVSSNPTVGFPTLATEWELFSQDETGNLGIHLSDGALPVESGPINWNLNGNYLQLGWNTWSESNNYGFEILDVTDDGNSKILGFISGKGNSTETQSYNWSGYLSEGGIRKIILTQIDLDGKSSILSVFSATLQQPNQWGIHRVWPNPFNPSTTIEIEIPESGFAELTAFSLSGQVAAMIFRGELQAGFNQVKWNAGGLSSGIYFLKINGKPGGFPVFLLK